VSAKLPLRHVSIRVPWHDGGWDGTVCRDPKGNAACLVLKEIRDTRDDDREETLAGQSIQKLDQATQWPACVGERMTFMAPFEFTRMVKHPYASFSDAHAHIKPVAFHHPPYSAATIPFRWMAREDAWELAEQLDLDVDPAREPMEGWLERNNWVQDHHNQRALLDTFFDAIAPDRSLCFFYAKQVPTVDDADRVLIGAGRVLGIGPPLEYSYASASKIRSYVWDRAIQHSIRPGSGDGFLLPYHELLARAAIDPTIDLRACTALPPADRRAEFSYAGEHVTHDGALAALLACREALENAKPHLETSIDANLRWIDERLGELWRLRGPAPGLGSALIAFGIDHGNFLALELASMLADNEDPFPLIDRVVADPSLLSERGQGYLSRTSRDKWNAIREKRPERRRLLELLARFELTPDQAKRFYVAEEREEIWPGLTDQLLLENAYLVYEHDRVSKDPVSVWTVDRGVFPAPIVRDAHPLPEDTKVDDPTDRRRVRALAVVALEAAATDGHTVQPRSSVVRTIRGFPLDPPCPVDGDLMDLVEDSFGPPIVIAEMATGEVAYQLDRLDETMRLIRAFVTKRLSGVRHEVTADWRLLIDEELGESGAGDELEERARQEKAATLAELAASRISVLIGPAGTGKTTLLKLLVNHPSVAAGDVLLLAPTGKARVRMQMSTKQKASTLAQFLVPFGRYDPPTGSYRVLGSDKFDGAKTVIVDEASMLTEEMLAALIDSLKGVDRLILVGDARQLPPIGAGRPFFDIVEQLQPKGIEAAFPRVGSGYAELTVRRRHIGEVREDVQLADWFSGQPLGAGEDEILSRLLEQDDMRTLRFVEWEGADDLREKLLDTLVDEVAELSGRDDVLGFELSIGGSEFESKAYFHRSKTHAKSESWQILSPVRGLTHGVRDLNRLVQTTFRAATVAAARDARFRKIPRPLGPEGIVYGDKVINLVNHTTDWVYPKDDALNYVANGEIGVVVGQYKSQNAKWKGAPWKLQVEFSSQPDFAYDFTPAQLQEEGTPMLELAYAVTVHKAQGSEFGLCLLVLPRTSRVLSRELLYTALTRQRDRIVILHEGDRSALKGYASDYFSETKRRLTNLFVPPKLTAVHDRFLEDRLIHKSSRGEPMRSKSEVIIADQLAAAGMDYEYEVPLLAPDGSTRWPDFTLIDADTGRTIYWEHCGMLSDPQYRARWERKLDWYNRQGILRIEESPPAAARVLVVTEDDEKGGMSSEAIRLLVASLS
jgi:hypothetical protein